MSNFTNTCDRITTHTVILKHPLTLSMRSGITINGRTVYKINNHLFYIIINLLYMYMYMYVLINVPLFQGSSCTCWDSTKCPC